MTEKSARLGDSWTARQTDSKTDGQDSAMDYNKRIQHVSQVLKFQITIIPWHVYLIYYDHKLITPDYMGVVLTRLKIVMSFLINPTFSLLNPKYPNGFRKKMKMLNAQGL